MCWLWRQALSPPQRERPAVGCRPPISRQGRSSPLAGHLRAQAAAAAARPPAHGASAQELAAPRALTRGEQRQRPSAGKEVARGHFPVPRGGVHRRGAEEVGSRPESRLGPGGLCVQGDRGMAQLQAGGGPLRQPMLCRRAAARGRGRGDIRLPLSSFMRWVNLTGWAGLAIGNLQLVAPHDETVLAAGLALERG